MKVYSNPLAIQQMLASETAASLATKKMSIIQSGKMIGLKVEHLPLSERPEIDTSTAVFGKSQSGIRRYSAVVRENLKTMENFLSMFEKRDPRTQFLGLPTKRANHVYPETAANPMKQMKYPEETGKEGPLDIPNAPKTKEETAVQNAASVENTPITDDISDSATPSPPPEEIGSADEDDGMPSIYLTAPTPEPTEDAMASQNAENIQGAGATTPPTPEETESARIRGQWGRYRSFPAPIEESDREETASLSTSEDEDMEGSAHPPDPEVARTSALFEKLTLEDGQGDGKLPTAPPSSAPSEDAMDVEEAK